MKQLKSLYFIKPCRPYNAGETAGFTEEVAARLVAGGAAIPVEDRDATKPPEKKAVKKPAAKKRAVKKSK